jgi:SPP1 family predicted phage head-tail adaptor
VPILGPSVAIGRRHTRVLLQNEGPPVADGAGGFTTSWVDLPPPADARVAAAAAGTTEHLAAGAVVTDSTTHVVTLPYRAGVSTATRVIVDGRALYVTGVRDPDERHIELVLACEERR